MNFVSMNSQGTIQISNVQSLKSSEKHKNVKFYFKYMGGLQSTNSSSFNLDIENFKIARSWPLL
jgi:hypothetical protein